MIGAQEEPPMLNIIIIGLPMWVIYRVTILNPCHGSVSLYWILPVDLLLTLASIYLTRE